MSRTKAICVVCGHPKRNPLARCACGFLPFSDYERARALILSERFAYGQTTVGRSAQDLERIAGEIRAGKAYLFDAREEQAAVDVARALAEESERRRKRNRRVLNVALVILLFAFALLLWELLSKMLLETGVE